MLGSIFQKEFHLPQRGDSLVERQRCELYLPEILLLPGKFDLQARMLGSDRVNRILSL